MRRQHLCRPLASSLLGGCMMAVVITTAWPQPPLSELDLRVTEADIAPQVRVRDYANRTVEEYSVNNNVYMIKITPTAGAPYYLVDSDGSGDMEWNRGQPGRDMEVPQWALFSW
ncbi:DUF2782 domain-containing protein [Halochromatium glycolicum]|uniref:DUF2782 domain-containing protein n=1 Tax=Halochromatium glycolicum TaxID=85075 RepID=A0AAJ0U0H5_9GAMM|nr:DUF2782 domain-containing protein [Halochromatium glycolicum]MBK1703138.1 hypothetical protein [Halochromatium glycolicum]